MKKKILMISVLLLLFAAVVSAQSADAFTEMIDAKQVTVGDIGYFLAVYRGFVPESASASEATSALQNEGIVADSVEADTPLTYRLFAGMLMRTWDVKGGLMYTITGADRYALRELQAKGFIPSSVDPTAVVSGYQALATFNNCMTKLEGN